MFKTKQKIFYLNLDHILTLYEFFIHIKTFYLAFYRVLLSSSLLLSSLDSYFEDPKL
jgi:hypothetical protein